MVRLRFQLAVFVAALFSLPALSMPDLDFEVPDTTNTAKVKSDATDIVVDLDMSCPREVVPAELAFDAERFAKPTVSIAEGENIRSVSKHCMLTASEYFAARQIMQDEQKIELTDRGTAGSGAVFLDKYTAEHCRNLYVPRRITAIQDASKVPSVDLAGELHVAGIYDVRGSAAQSAIKAKRIKLYPGGWIGSSSPNVKSIAFKADKIETLITGKAPGSAERVIRDEIYSKDKSGKKRVEQVITGDYELKQTETTLIKANDEFIPTEGVDSAVEIGLYRQQRESCQPK